MGSYNLVCALSNLPILHEDNVVWVGMEENTSRLTGGNPNGNFFIHSIPIYGTYDDYGFFEPDGEEGFLVDLMIDRLKAVIYNQKRTERQVSMNIPEVIGENVTLANINLWLKEDLLYSRLLHRHNETMPKKQKNFKAFVLREVWDAFVGKVKVFDDKTIIDGDIDILRKDIWRRYRKLQKIVNKSKERFPSIVPMADYENWPIYPLDYARCGTTDTVTQVSKILRKHIKFLQPEDGGIDNSLVEEEINKLSVEEMVIINRRIDLVKVEMEMYCAGMSWYPPASTTQIGAFEYEDVQNMHLMLAKIAEKRFINYYKET